MKKFVNIRKRISGAATQTVFAKKYMDGLFFEEYCKNLKIEDLKERQELNLSRNRVAIELKEILEDENFSDTEKEENLNKIIKKYNFFNYTHSFISASGKLNSTISFGNCRLDYPASGDAITFWKKFLFKKTRISSQKYRFFCQKFCEILNHEEFFETFGKTIYQTRRKFNFN